MRGVLVAARRLYVAHGSGAVKPSLQQPMSRAFDPAAVEAHWSECWEADLRRRRSERGSGGGGTERERFSMVIPPPNVTGTLHLGHALTVAVEDALARYYRMQGRDVVWVPGTDHAGIATQVVVEKELKREGMTRHDLGRAAFVQRVMQWKEEKGSVIAQQLRKIGASLNWERELFTMDEAFSAAVVEAFVRLHERGLLYRAHRLVPWCPQLQSVISDIETEEHEVAGPTLLRVPGMEQPVAFGHIYHIGYQLADDATVRLPVATTRPETIFGDRAVAVHPKDERFAQYIGRRVLNPLTGEALPVIGDGELVDVDVGTGCVKVTPAHDTNDYACGERHQLSMRCIFSDTGYTNAEVPEQWRNLHRFQARARIVQQLTEQGNCVAHEHATSVSRCSRSGDILEPMPKSQWYVACSDMAQRALQFSESGDMTFAPPRFQHEWRRWLEQPLDWCVSRQLWWGHRVPAWREEETGRWIVARCEEEARQQASSPSATLARDNDVLDTWFSSALFPLVAFGWPRASAQELARYYPLDVMETGSDILFFWVARMAMLCSEMHSAEQLPFKQVMLHPMVRDREGRKMSKSVGNVIDPLDVIGGVSLQEMRQRVLDNAGHLTQAEVKRAARLVEREFPAGIAECGTDALRFALLHSLEQVDHINVDMHLIAKMRHFCNKLWNASKFVFAYVEQEGVGEERDALIGAAVPERWLQARLQRLTSEVHGGVEKRELHKATAALLGFWHDFCDHYIEWAKVRRGGQQGRQVAGALRQSLSAYLRLLHPFMPFVTEELWQRLHVGAQRDTHEFRSIMWHPLPLAKTDDDEKEEESVAAMQAMIEIVAAARSMRVSSSLPANVRPRILLSCAPDADAAAERLLATVVQHETEIAALARAGQVTRVQHGHVSQQDTPARVTRDGLMVALDVEVQHETKRQEAELLEAKLSKARRKREDLEQRRSAMRQHNVPKEVCDRTDAAIRKIDAQIAALQESMNGSS